MEEISNEKRREFNVIVGELSRKYQVPFLVSICLGTEEENYVLFKRDIADLDFLTVGQMRDLRAGKTVRKEALSEVLSPETFDALKVASMGDIYSERLAHYVWDKAMYRIQS